MLRSSRAAARGVRERGSSLVLMPAAVLVLVVLAAICVDLAAVQLGQRELVVAAQAAANDAAAAGFDEHAFYDVGDVRLDRGAARRAAVASLAANAPDASLVRLVVDAAAAEVEVVVSSAVATVFARGLPGGPRSIAVHARAAAALGG